ncbi:hypothetical protein SE856_03170 [Mycoplasmoides gallisepticum]|nr:hypothetical protein SE856_03170 [Mycoplasmoides gallisepticum]
MGQELNKLKKHKIISIVLMAIGALILLSGIALTAVIASPINSVEVTEMMNGQEVTTTKKISTFAFLINMLPNYQLSTLGYLQITEAAAGLVVGIVLLALGATFFVKTRRKTNEMLAALQDAEEEEEVAQEEQAEENVEATPTQQAEVKTEQLIGTQLVTTDVASTQAVGTEEVQGVLLPPSQQPTEMRPAPWPMGSPKLLGPNQADHPQHGPRLMNAHPGQPRPQQAGPRPMGAGGSNQPRPMPNGLQNNKVQDQWTLKAILVLNHLSHDLTAHKILNHAQCQITHKVHDQWVLQIHNQALNKLAHVQWELVDLTNQDQCQIVHKTHKVHDQWTLKAILVLNQLVSDLTAHKLTSQDDVQHQIILKAHGQCVQDQMVGQTELN